MKKLYITYKLIKLLLPEFNKFLFMINNLLNEYNCIVKKINLIKFMHCIIVLNKYNRNIKLKNSYNSVHINNIYM